MVTIEQIKAGRALINWAQQDLADQTGLSKTAIANVESGKHRPTEKNMKGILDAFDRNGVRFTLMGVEKKDDFHRVFEGEECFLKLLDDIYYKLKGTNQEVLFINSNEALANKASLQAELRMRTGGIKIRALPCEGDTFLQFPLEEYRYIPKKFYIDNIVIIYGQWIALYSNNPSKVSVFKEPSFSQTLINIFDQLWNQYDQPTRTTAERTYY